MQKTGPQSTPPQQNQSGTERQTPWQTNPTLGPAFDEDNCQIRELTPEETKVWLEQVRTSTRRAMAAFFDGLNPPMPKPE